MAKLKSKMGPSPPTSWSTSARSVNPVKRRGPPRTKFTPREDTKMSYDQDPKDPLEHFIPSFVNVPMLCVAFLSWPYWGWFSLIPLVVACMWDC